MEITFPYFLLTTSKQGLQVWGFADGNYRVVGFEKTSNRLRKS